MMEKVDVYNKFREKLKIIKDRNGLDLGEYRISVHVWIIDSRNNILVVKRSEKEDVFPGLWAQIGGGVKAGDDSKTTVIKECEEELNLDVKLENVSYVASYIRIKDIVDVYMVNQDIDIEKLNLQEDEVKEVKLVTFKEIEDMIKYNIVVPSINPSYELFKNYIEEYRN